MTGVLQVSLNVFSSFIADIPSTPPHLKLDNYFENEKEKACVLSRDNRLSWRSKAKTIF